MGRGVSAGGGQSSLDYLFANDESANNAPTEDNAPIANIDAVVSSEGQAVDGSSTENANVESPVDKQAPPVTIPVHLINNYHRAEGQNCGNFITDRPSSKVLAAPGGGSSLNYLFGSPPPENK
ncbi:hypothetical protein PIB30_082739 [Stylosanthes scabra]|uniref:Protein SPIRAL1-like 1 n=1 Tax=Stylosanthes scabra TaxID=79078 RepID=A0ABU6ZRD1_9FABA|nr:hypothetical protein [Stylosanthes scabra]